METQNALHAADRAWLEGEIERAKQDGVQLVVVTHHAPSMQGTSHPMFDASPLAHAFGTPMDNLLAPPVAAWVYGHTHYSTWQERKAAGHGEDGGEEGASGGGAGSGVCLLVSNQLGYPNESRGLTGFSPSPVTFSVEANRGEPAGLLA